MGNKGYLKKRKAQKGESIGFSEIDSLYKDIAHPVFCFKYLHRKYNVGVLSPDQRNQFLNQLYNLSQLTWNVINTSPRHGMGFEKITLKQIKPDLNPSFTEDVQHLLSFRFDGMKPFLGHRRGFILHLLFIDPNMEVYDHD